MALIHQAELSPGKIEMISSWIGAQRWYTGTGTPQLQAVAAYRFDDPAGEVGMETHLVADTSGTEEALYQVPLTYRAAPAPDVDEAALLGTMQHSVLGTRWIYDATADPVYAAALLRTIAGAGTGAAEDVVNDDGRTTTRRATTTHVQGSGVLGPEPRHGSTAPQLQIVGARRLAGEQSNTSVIADVLVDGVESQVIVKVFRVLHSGTNPDVEIQRVLSLAGSDLVPTTLGSLSGIWQDGRSGEHHDLSGSGDLAFAQQFLPNAPDAWRVALAAAVQGSDFTAPARELGRDIARLHTELASRMGTAQPDEAAIEAVARDMRGRYRRAVEVDPSLQDDAPAVEQVIDEMRDAEWPPLQRIHGDFHLGQVLQPEPGRWVVLDFEGEPLRPLAERRELDSPVRDIAGLLRSIDYVAGAAYVQHQVDRRTWAAATRAAFLTGYDETGVLDLAAVRPLLRAYELDKAFYEVDYEQRHRPAWAPIPRSAVDRLLAVSGSTGPTQPAPARDEPSDDRTEHVATSGEKMPASPAPRRAEEAQPAPLSHEEADRLLRGEHRGPHGLLGGHPGDEAVTIRVLRPLAESVDLLLAGDEVVPMAHEYGGIWSVAVPGQSVPDYRVRAEYADGVQNVTDDPYRFLPTLGEVDLHLIGEGRHEQLWTVLGAQVRTYPSELGEVHGTSFAVWAPNARAVQLVGDFNRWDGTQTPMRVLGDSGVWELFVPGVGDGATYKFNILGADGVWRTKADPLARRAEIAPRTASVVSDSEYQWRDEDWMTRRADEDARVLPMSAYEVHLGSWRVGQTYTDLSEHLVNYVKDLGFTHVEFMPVMDHPYPPSWGYHVTSYYAPNSRFGSPDEFRALVDTLHRNGIGVLLDWVPGHFATDDWALMRFDGTPIYEHPDPRRGWHPEWGSYIFDFGRPQVRNFLVANALYWLEEFHIDGLRVDGVASMLYLDYARNDGEWYPNEYGGKENLEAVRLLQETNATAQKRVRGIVMIAEESTAWPGVTAPTTEGGLGFTFKWNMGWMHDSLSYMSREPVHRRFHHDQITFGLTYAFDEHFVLPISHDEVVHGKGSLLRKMPGNRWEELANLRAYLAFMWSHPGKKLLFMGCEFGQESEWADGRSLDWWLLDQPAHWGVHALTRDLNTVYRSDPALWEQDGSPEGFRWVEANDGDGNTFAYVRYSSGADDTRSSVVVVLNFSGSSRRDLRVGFPHAGEWREAINTDSRSYGGSGEGNLGAVTAVDEPYQGQPASARVTLGPLSALWFVADDAPEASSTTDSTEKNDD